MRIKLLAFVFLVCGLSGTVFAMEELNMLEQHEKEKRCRRIAKTLVRKISGNTKDKNRVERFQKTLFSMAKKNDQRFQQFENWKKKVREKKKNKEKETDPEEIKKVVELTMLIQDHLEEKNERLKEKKQGLQDDNEKKDGKISSCKKLTGALSGVSIAGVVSAVIAIYQAVKGGNNDCQLKTNCQSLISSNSSLSELSTFCVDVINNCG